MNKLHQAVFYFILTLCLLLGHSGICGSREQYDAAHIHQQAWNRFLTGKNPTNKYALYSNRLIFVKHPELYLKADIETLKRIQSVQPSLYSRFSINKIRKLKIIKEQDRYPVGAPFLPLIDRRVLPPTATLYKQLNDTKVVPQERITALEKAILVYYWELEHQKKNNSTIVYCSNSDAYLIRHDRALSISNLEGQTLSNLPCEPMLAFNNNDSWSPLLNKIPNSKLLKNIVNRISVNINPSQILTAEEINIVPRLEALSELTPAELNTALLFAKKLGPIVFRHSKIETDQNLMTQWRIAFNQYPIELENGINRIHTGLSHLLMQSVNIVGNTLSPITALIASQASCSSKKDNASCLIDSYKHFFSWNLLWDWGLTSFTIDEALAVGGGGVCAEQSTYMAAILDLLDMDYYILHFTGLNEQGKKEDHRIIYVPSWNVTFSNNKMIQRFNEPNSFKGLVYIYDKHHWIMFTDDMFAGNISSEMAAQLITGFIRVSLKNNFTSDYSCIPFSIVANYRTCSDSVEKLHNKNSYYTINFN